MFSSVLKVINIFCFKKRKNHAEYNMSFIKRKILGHVKKWRHVRRKKGTHINKEGM